MIKEGEAFRKLRTVDEPVSLHNYPPQMRCQCLLNVGRVALQEYSVKPDGEENAFYILIL